MEWQFVQKNGENERRGQGGDLIRQWTFFLWKVEQKLKRWTTQQKSLALEEYIQEYKSVGNILPWNSSIQLSNKMASFSVLDLSVNCTSSMCHEMVFAFATVDETVPQHANAAIA